MYLTRDGKLVTTSPLLSDIITSGRWNDADATLFERDVYVAEYEAGTYDEIFNLAQAAGVAPPPTAAAADIIPRAGVFVRLRPGGTPLHQELMWTLARPLSRAGTATSCVIAGLIANAKQVSAGIR